MKKTYINCYTITTANNKLSVNPGISTKIFSFSPHKESITLPQSQVCRFAVEEKFYQLNKTLSMRWIVIDNNQENLFYRFFKNDAEEADNFIYILVNYDYPNEMPKYLSDNAILIEPKRALIQFKKIDGLPTCFAFKNKIFSFSASGISIN